MRRLLSSYRWRRRILWALPFVVGAVGLAVLVASLPSENKTLAEEPEPAPVADGAPQPAETFGRRTSVTPATRREVNVVLKKFVRHAVARDRPEEAWDLATPDLKAGQTRAAWRRGEVPVYPFPARVEEATGWYVLESFEDDLLLTLLMHARRGNRAIAYQVELKRVGEGQNRRWLVDSFIPERVYTPGSATDRPERDASREPSSLPTARLSTWWFVVPGILLSLIVLVPLGVVVLNWRRGRRADEAYRRSLLEGPDRSAP